MSRARSVATALCALFLPAAFAADLDRSVTRILTANCSECHSERTKTSGVAATALDPVAAGGNKYERAIPPANPAASPLIRILKGEITPRMPFGKELAAADLASIEQWIRQLKPSDAVRAGTEPWLWP